MTKTEKFQELLDTAGYKSMEYSGRFMYGTQCVAVHLGNATDLFSLGKELAFLAEQKGFDDFIPTPKIDDFGRGIVAYWPQFVVESEPTEV